MYINFLSKYNQKNIDFAVTKKTYKKIITINIQKIYKKCIRRDIYMNFTAYTL